MEGGATADEPLRLQSSLVPLTFLSSTLDKSLAQMRPAELARAPLCIKLRRRVLRDHLVLRAPGIDRMTDAVANSNNHVAKRLQARPVRHFAARRHHVKPGIGPSVERFQQAIERPALRKSNL